MYMTNPKIVVRLILFSLLALIPIARADDSTHERRHRAFQQNRDAILQAMQNDLQGVHTWCVERNLSNSADYVVQYARELADKNRKYTPPRLAQTLNTEDGSPDERNWRTQLRHHQTERGKEMYIAARSALRAGLPSLAFSMIGDVLYLDSDHKFARSIIGQQLFKDPTRSDDPLYEGEWVSPFEVQMRGGSKPHIYDSRFGWIPAASIARYEEGFRPWQGNWISKEKEAELRREFRNAWEIRSEHFLVKTNVSLEAGVELTEKLEVFYEWMQQNMAAFFDTPEALEDRFEQAARSATRRKGAAPMEVHYYATREEFRKRLEGKIPPNIEVTGFYWDADQTCYFYAKDDRNDFSTVFHEATHQILDVHTRSSRSVAARNRGRQLKLRPPYQWILCENSNFWMIEGIACYMESFQIMDGEVSIGDPQFVRFDMARRRVLEPELFFYVPLQQYCRLGKETFQYHENISQLYTQASGLTHFMMHFDDGVYRDDFFALLAAAYRPPIRGVVTEEPSFDKISGVPFDMLDRQYRVHMQNLIP